jgi:hypothetical protein
MSAMNNTTVIAAADPHAAYEGWYYTISGCGGDLQEWVQGCNAALQEAGIGTPTRWLRLTGAEVNAFAETKGPVKDPFSDDLTLLVFPLEGLHQGRLAMFKLQQGDRWFTDIVDNMVDNWVEDDDEEGGES